MRIEHSLHEHPLTLIEETNVTKVLCHGCKKGLSGFTYGCRKCCFFLHKSCAELQQELHHFFHPCPLNLRISSGPGYYCNACYKLQSGFSFCCSQCDFDLDIDCALRPSNTTDKNQIQHFTHWHPLTLFDLTIEEPDGDGNGISCAICGKLCFDLTYGCKKCSFFLHNSCMDLPRKIKHFFHPHPLVLVPKQFYECDGCERSCSGLAFGCGNCDFDLDMDCALLPTLQSEVAHKIQHAYHDHPLVLSKIEKENENLENEVVCEACRGDCSGLTFTCRRCKFNLHKSCAMESLPQEIKHPFHLHPLVMKIYSPKSYSFGCGACGLQDDYLLAYSCNQCSNFDIHIGCSSLKPSFKYGNHQHLLTLFEKRGEPGDCNICGNPCKTLFLRCVACHLNLHFYCHPSMPKTIVHKCHVHPLTLTESPINFELDWCSEDSDEFYCDVCETKREKWNSVYCCDECKFVAEIQCVMSEVLPYLVAEGKTAENAEEEGNSEIAPVAAKLGEEVAELRAKLETLGMEIEGIEEQKKELQAMLEAKRSERMSLEKKIDTLEAEDFLEQ